MEFEFVQRAGLFICIEFNECLLLKKTQNNKKRVSINHLYFWSSINAIICQWTFEIFVSDHFCIAGVCFCHRFSTCNTHYYWLGVTLFALDVLFHLCFFSLSLRSSSSVVAFGFFSSFFLVCFTLFCYDIDNYGPAVRKTVDYFILNESIASHRDRVVRAIGKYGDIEK